MMTLTKKDYKQLAEHFNLVLGELKKKKDIYGYIAREKTIPRSKVKQICLALNINNFKEN